MTERMRQIVALMLLSGAIVMSAMAAIYAKHEARKSFTELQRLQIERDEMEIEWGQLQIEQSTWSTYGRVEQLARKDMQMREPETEQMTLIGP